MPTLRTYEGLKLHMQFWPAPGYAHGTVQIVHGLGEHIGRYAGVAAKLNDAGWHVVGHDHRGHGRSEGPRGDVPSGAVLLNEITAVMDHVRGEGPYILLGHSLGGLLAACYVAEMSSQSPARWMRQVDGLVLSSPALDIRLSRFKQRLLSVLVPLAPHLRMPNGLKPAWISRERAVVRAYTADRLVHNRVTPKLVQFMVEAGDAVFTAAPYWRVPTLLMWAGADRCVNPEGSEAFADAAPADVVQALAFPSLCHEIFNEPERAHVMRHLTRWLSRFELPPTTDLELPP
jgi:alpha-beta hydrolase superfamily lysophospholipase